MRRTSAVVAVLLLLAAGCGTDDGGRSSGPPSYPVHSVPEEMALVENTLTTLLDALAAARRSTGAYPADVTGIDLWPAKGRVVYARDGGGFRACVQERSDGPWVSATSRAGHRSLDDRGRCSFAAPPAGSGREVRRDLLRLLATVGEDCRGRPGDAALRARGVLGEGNRVGGCRRVSWQEGGVVTTSWCVQHGADGAWAAYDGDGTTVWAEGGTCELGPAER